MPNLCKISCESGSKAGLLIIVTSMKHFFLGSFISYDKGGKSHKNKQKQTKNLIKTRATKPNKTYAFERKNICTILG